MTRLDAAKWQCDLSSAQRSAIFQRQLAAERDRLDFAQRFPVERLQLLDALVADDRSQMPYELGKALEVMAEADPALRRTREWRRLNDLTV